jgi:hypothetical protein
VCLLRAAAAQYGEAVTIAAFAGLADALRRLVPEVDGLAWREEERADCARCPMTEGHGDPAHPWAFDPASKCCTAQPTLANFLVGRALRRGEPGRGRILARLAEPAGVGARGIEAPDDYDRRYVETIEVAFGRDQALRCPYWVGGEESCGVWLDRSAICRTWFCKHEAGVRGAVEWSELRMVLGAAEARLAARCVTDGIAAGREPVSARHAGAAASGAAVTAEAWVDWYLWCAAHVDELGDEVLAELGGSGLAQRRSDLVALTRRPRRALPELVVPAVRERAEAGDAVLLSGYSSFDAVRAPREVFAFLARLDGVRPWRQALAETLSDMPDAALGEALVRELYRVGAVQSPAGGDAGVEVDYVGGGAAGVVGVGRPRAR